MFNFTPGIFSEFLEVQQVAERKGKFQILLFGRGDEEDFLVKGFDLAAEAVASLDNIKLVFVGVPEGELEEVKNRFLKCGIHATDLTVRSFLKDRQSLKTSFCEVDLVVMHAFKNRRFWTYSTGGLICWSSHTCKEKFRF